MREDLIKAIHELELAGASLASGVVSRSELGRDVSDRVSVCAKDVVASAFILSDLDLELRVEIAGNTAFLDPSNLGAYLSLQTGSGRPPGSPIGRDRTARRLVVVYKSMLFFVRAYQDTVAAAARIAEGKTHGSHSSMHELMKKRSPLGKRIDIELPGYGAWFRTWRNMRNRVKEGADFHVVPPAGDPGIVAIAYRHLPNGQRNHVVDHRHAARVSHIIEGLEWSSKVSDVVRRELTKEPITHPTN